ncbi:hypothetical protein [Salinibaculum rarum]|uniref:hypothetical protein n=1 Tax=Salinibaculum rarum TaxID=3058903 RepID=UPI00265E72D6|nr:hypothetical protein [Salinibaculum sp. KK48]
MPAVHSNDSETCEWGIDDDLNQVIEDLSEGDEVLVNDRSQTLTVFEKTDTIIGSNREPTHVALLEGNGGRVYRLRGPYRSPDDHSTPPCLELRQEDEWTTKSSAVTHIAVTNWTARIAADTTATEYIEPEIPTPDGVAATAAANTTLAANRDPCELSGPPLGDCPKCGNTVMRDDDRVVCTRCSAWCWYAQWEAYTGNK